MKIITDYEELVGKTIAYSHMAQFANQITLATTDGDVLMASFEIEDDDNIQIRVLWEHVVLNIIKESTHLQNSLSVLGIWDLAAYQKEVQERQRILKEERAKAQEVRERKQLAELKAKYES